MTCIFLTHKEFFFFKTEKRQKPPVIGAPPAALVLTSAACFQETIGPDPHSPGSPLPTSAYAADIGYLVDGTDLQKAGNAINHA